MTTENYSVENFMEVQLMNEEEKRGIDKMVDLILKNIFHGNIDNNEEFKSTYRNVSSAYHLMKQKFSEVMRDGGERYFEHLRAVTNIILDFIPNPNKEKVLIALLHDVIEDIPEINFEVINALFGPKVAIAVKAVSKNNWKDYLDSNELDLFDTSNDENRKIIEKKGKERRNNEYFGHLDSMDSIINHVKDIISEYSIDGLTEEEIIEIAKNTVDVKLADRIHNLSTQWDENNVEKTIRKIEETKKYFLKIAQETNIIAFNKIKSLLLNLEIKVEKYNKRVEEIVN